MEAKREEEGGESNEPSSWCLFEAVERLTEETYMIWMGSADEARWLRAVHCLLEIAVEEGVLYIELVNRP